MTKGEEKLEALRGLLKKLEPFREDSRMVLPPNTDVEIQVGTLRELIGDKIAVLEFLEYLKKRPDPSSE